MAKQLSVYVWCDLCLGDGHREEAVHRTVPITVGKMRPRALDLCDRHYKQLLQPVLDALAEHGVDLVDGIEPVPPGRSKGRQRGWKRQPGPYRCLAGCNAAPLKTVFTLEQHLLRIHDMSFDEYVSRYGEVVALTPEELAELVVEVQCQVEGCDQVYSTRETRWPQQAMISHMRGRHGLSWRPGQTLDQATRVGQ